MSEYHRSSKRAKELNWQWCWAGIALVLLMLILLIAGRNPLESQELAEMLAGMRIEMTVEAPAFTAVLEKGMMVCLWILFAIVLAAPYVIWSVRGSAFYSSEDACRKVEDTISGVLTEHPDSLSKRFAAWRQKLDRNPVLIELRRRHTHLAEVTNQISLVVLQSEHTLDRYFMTQARDIKEEEYQKLNLVNFAANVGPVIGFAGTILGMILAFSQLGKEMSKEMIGSIAGAIYIALITTLFGLLIKAVAALMKYIIQHQIDKHVTRILTISSNVTKKRVANMEIVAPSSDSEDED